MSHPPLQDNKIVPAHLSLAQRALRRAEREIKARKQLSAECVQLRSENEHLKKHQRGSAMGDQITELLERQERLRREHQDELLQLERKMTEKYTALQRDFQSYQTETATKMEAQEDALRRARVRIDNVELQRKQEVETACLSLRKELASATQRLEQSALSCQELTLQLAEQTASSAQLTSKLAYLKEVMIQFMRVKTDEHKQTLLPVFRSILNIPQTAIVTTAVPVTAPTESSSWLPAGLPALPALPMALRSIVRWS